MKLLLNINKKILILNDERDLSKIQKSNFEFIILTYETNYNLNKLADFSAIKSQNQGFSKIIIKNKETKHYFYDSNEDKLLLSSFPKSPKNFEKSEYMEQFINDMLKKIKNQIEADFKNKKLYN